MSESVHTSPAALLDPENMGVAFGISLLSSIPRYCVNSYVLPALTAIFDLLVTRMSESVHTSPATLLDPKNVGVAFGISLLSSLVAEILRYFTSTSGLWRPSLIYRSRRHHTVRT